MRPKKGQRIMSSDTCFLPSRLIFGSVQFDQTIACLLCTNYTASKPNSYQNPGHNLNYIPSTKHEFRQPPTGLLNNSGLRSQCSQLFP